LRTHDVTKISQLVRHSLSATMRAKIPAQCTHAIISINFLLLSNGD